MRFKQWCMYAGVGARNRMAEDLEMNPSTISRYSSGSNWPEPYYLGMLHGYTGGVVDWWTMLQKNQDFQEGVERGKIVRADNMPIEETVIPESELAVERGED